MTPRENFPFRLLIAPVLLAMGGALIWYWPALRSIQEADLDSNAGTAQRLRVVGQQVRQGAAAVPNLVELLASESTRDRRDAALGLGWIGGEAESAIPALLAAIDDLDSIVREHSVTALGRIGADVSGATDRIAQHLADESHEVRRAAANLLLATGEPAIPAVRGVLTHGDADAQLLAISTLRELNANDQETLDAFREYRSTARVRCQNLEAALLGILESRHATRDDLQSALRSNLWRVVARAMDLILEQDQPDAGLTADLAGLAASSAPRELTCEMDPPDNSSPTTGWIRQRAMSCLSKMGPAAAAAEDELRRLVVDSSADPSIKSSAISTLVRIGCDVEPYVPLVVELAVKHPTLWEYSIDYGAGAPWAGLLREIAPEEIPKVVGILRGKLAVAPDNTARDDRRVSVLILLGQFGPEAEVALPELLSLLDSPDYDLFDTVLTVIEKMGSVAAPAVPILARLLDQSLGPDFQPRILSLPYYRRSGYRAVDILQTLNVLGPAAAEIRPKLLAINETLAAGKAADDSLVAFRFHVLKTLASIGGVEAIVLQGMREIARYPNLMVSTPALELLFKNDSDPDFPVAVLAEHLDRLAADPRSNSPQRWLSSSLLKCLSGAGSRGAPCVLPLAHAADNPTLFSRSELLETLAILLRTQGEWSASDPIVREIVPQMIDYVSEQSPAVSYGAVSVLEALGPAATDAIPALEAALARVPDAAELRREVFAIGRRLSQIGGLTYAPGSAIPLSTVPSDVYREHLRRALERIQSAAPQNAD